MEILLALIAILISFYVYLTWNFNFWKNRGVTGPTPYPYVGTFPKAILDKTSNYIQETSEIYRKYFRKHRFIGVFEYREPKLLILDPSLVADIYVKYFKHFGENSLCEVIDAKTDPLFKPNPFIEKLPEWRERRTELAPAFTTLKVKSVYPIIENACQQLVQFINKRIKAGQTVFESKDIAARVIADIMYNILFGIDAKAFDGQSEYLYYAINQFNSTPYDKIWNTLYSVFPFLRKIVPNRFTTKEFTNWFIDLYTHAVELRKQSNIVRDDYLNFMIDLEKRKNVPDHLLYAHAYTLFLDGFETTSYILGCLMNLMSQNQDCQEKLREEVKGYNQINFDNLHQMPYLDSVIHETTRLSPFPFPIWKTCTENVELEDFDGHTIQIEKGTKIILPINALHSHPDYYANAEKFDPDRYDNENMKKLKDAGVFMPFGNGPRICLGMKYAVTSIKAILCALLDNFELISKPVENMTSSPTGMLFFSNNKALFEIKKIK